MLFPGFGSTFRKKNWGQLASEFSDLVGSIRISEKCEKVVMCEKDLVA